MATRVLLADDHPVVRQGIRALLEQHGFAVVAEAADGREAVDLAQRMRPDVAVLDVAMPLLNGLDAARVICKSCPETRVVALTVLIDSPRVLQALRDGVRGFVNKTQAAEDLFRAIHEVVRGGMYVSPGASRAVADAFRTAAGELRDPLTVREREVLQLVAESKSTKQIAALMNISVKTVEFHRTRMMEKLDIHDTAGLVRYAIRQGLVTA